MDPSSLSIVVEPGGATTARLYRAGSAGAPCLILAHGAGAGQQHPFMVSAARAIAGQGVDVMTFDFLYMTAGRKAPDRAPVLELTWRTVIEAARERLSPGALVVGGKSMGGRIASQVLASESAPPAVAGLVLLGYPLHPPGRPEVLRVAHLPALHTPTLIVQGSRDEFGGEDEVRTAFAAAPARLDWYIVGGGDHSFKVPRGAGTPQADVLRGVFDAVAAWVRARA